MCDDNKPDSTSCEEDSKLERMATDETADSVAQSISSKSESKGSPSVKDEMEAKSPSSPELKAEVEDDAEEADGNTENTTPGQKRRGRPPKPGNERKRKTKAKDINAPKAPINGYVRFLNDNRERCRKVNPEVPFANITKLLAQEWSQLKTEDKQKYLDAAEKDRERYMKEVEEYQQTDCYKQFRNRAEASLRTLLGTTWQKSNNGRFDHRNLSNNVYTCRVSQFFLSNSMKALQVAVAAAALAAIIIPAVQGQSSRPQLGYFTFLRYRNQECEGRYGQNGTCVTEADCQARQGSDVGRCAEGYGVCCRVSFTCKMVNKKNETEFVNPGYPNGETGTSTCDVTLEKTPDICQIRLDFIEFSLAQPDEKGLCSRDSFMVRNTVGEKFPILCGENGGQHIYIDTGRQSGNPIVLSVVSTGAHSHERKWRIKVSYIPCGSLDIVPPGCLQNFRAPSAIVRSFNYGAPLSNNVRYLSNLRYAVCLRVEENFCSIKWETENEDSFSFGRPYDSATSGANCEDDFINIDQGSTYGMGPGEDRFCGIKLHERNVLISHSKPFLLRVTSNSDAAGNSMESQTGFSLRYTQLPCVD